MVTEANYGSFKQAAHYKAGRIAPIRLGVLHRTAGQESAKGTGAEGVQSMFADPNGRVASAHITVDQNSVARSVHDKDTAYAAKYANACGLHLEQVGMANQTRAQWLDPISKATINNAVRVAKDWSNLYGIAKRRLSDKEVLAVLNDPVHCTITGWTDHATIQRMKPSSGHTDPGPNYPWDVFLAGLTAGTAPAPRKPVPNPHKRPDYTNHPLRRGATGEGVKWVQWALRQTEDGSFGPATESAVKAMQRKYGLSPVDGVVGAKTGARLATFTR